MKIKETKGCLGEISLIDMKFANLELLKENAIKKEQYEIAKVIQDEINYQKV